MINRLKILLEQNEFSALSRLALTELRDPESQARHIIREELEKLGLLKLEILTKNNANYFQEEKSSVKAENEQLTGN